MTCPKCYSSNVAHKDEEFKAMSHNAKHHAGHAGLHAVQGHPGMLVAVAGAWLIGKTVHAFSSTYACQDPNCGHRFS